MSLPLVLRLPRTDVDHDFVLVNVQQSGSSDLDLKLVATEGESPFVTILRQKAISKLHLPNSLSQNGHWHSVLAFILLRTIPNDPDLTRGVEAVASLSQSQLTIVIRKKISGITQRLGAITLDKDEDEDIQLFDWSVSAVSRADALSHQLATLQLSVTDQQKTIADLTTQLDDLVKAKKSHQDEMLRKFAALLNTKKLKIRDQQRLLAHAKVDPKAADQVHSARSANGHKPATSRSSKRKANDNLDASETDDDGFEGTDLGDRIDQDDDMRQESLTPEISDVDTEDDSDGGFAPAPVPSQSQRSQRPGGDVASREKTLDTPVPKEVKPAYKEPEMAPPPRRELPFARKDKPVSSFQTLPKPSTTLASSRPPPVTDDDETDDEL